MWVFVSLHFYEMGFRIFLRICLIHANTVPMGCWLYARFFNFIFFCVLKLVLMKINLFLCFGFVIALALVERGLYNYCIKIAMPLTLKSKK